MKKHMYLVKKEWIITFVFFMGLLFLVQPSASVYAEDQNPAGATGFTYNIAFPDNQIDKELGYYHLKMTPGKEQKLTIALSNPSAEKTKIDVAINGAKTNQNGVIEYGESTLKNDASLKYDFTDIVKGPKSVELAPGETKNLELAVKMPEAEFDGLIAGGIQLMRSGQTDGATKGGGSKIVNQYAYVVAVVLQETDNAIAPDLSFNHVKAGQTNYRNSIFVNFSNVMASYLDNMVIEVQVMEKGKKTVLYERKQTEMRMAPNSFIEFPVSMNGERMVAGDYVADILVTSGKKKWHWTKDFKITDKDANKFNERDVGLVQEKGLDWKLILLLVLAIIVVVVVLFSAIHFYRKKKNKKLKAAQKRKAKKKK